MLVNQDLYRFVRAPQGWVGAPAEDNFEFTGKDFLGVNSCFDIACCLSLTVKSGLLPWLLVGIYSSFEHLGGVNNSLASVPRNLFKGDEQGCSLSEGF